jgi:hypothetical protein
MVERRIPTGGQVLLLALIPSLLAYHALFGEMALPLATVIYGGVVFVLTSVALFVEGGVQSPWYLLSGGLVTSCFGVWRSVSGVSASSILLALGGLGILVWGVTEYRPSTARRARE